MTKMTKMAMAVALCVASSAAFGQTVSVDNTNATINTANHVSTVTLTRGGQAVEGFEFEMTYVNADLALATSPAPHPNVTPSVGGFACAVSTVGRLRCVGTPSAPVPETITIAVQFSVGPDAVPAPGSPLVIENVLFIDGAANTVATTSTNGSVVIGTAPPDVNLVFAPAPGATVTFPAGVAGSVQNASIGITTTGTVGSGTVSNCALSGTGAASFTAPAGTITVNGGDTGSIPLTCTLPASGGAATATLTCTETDADTPPPGAARTWNLSCPQGSAVPANPVITTVTPTGAFAMPSGTIGQTVTRPIQFSAAGGVGTGSATIACSGAAPLTVAPASQTVTGSNQPTPVSVSIPLTASAQGPITVTCTVTDLNGTRTDTFDVTAAAGTALPPPSVVPASSLLSQLILIALLAGLGVAVVGFRRS